jgi:hypothetical protein
MFLWYFIRRTLKIYSTAIFKYTAYCWLEFSWCTLDLLILLSKWNFLSFVKHLFDFPLTPLSLVNTTLLFLWIQLPWVSYKWDQAVFTFLCRLSVMHCDLQGTGLPHLLLDLVLGIWCFQWIYTHSVHSFFVYCCYEDIEVILLTIFAGNSLNPLTNCNPVVCNWRKFYSFI